MTRRGWALLALMAVLWGMPYLLIRIALRSFPPFVVADLRLVIGAGFLLPLAWRLGALRRWRRLLLPTIVVAVLEAGLPYPLITFGEQHIGSGLAGLLIATMPLLLAMMAIGLDSSERVALPRFAGLAMGLLGVGTLLGLDVGDRNDGRLLGAGLLVGAAACYALGALLVKRWFASEHPLLAPATTTTLSAILLAGPAAATWSIQPEPLPIAAVAALGVLSTALGFVAFFALIAEVGAARSSLVAYLGPLVAVALGRIVLDEPVTASTLLGAVLILGGSTLASVSPRPRQMPDELLEAS